MQHRRDFLMTGLGLVASTSAFPLLAAARKDDPVAALRAVEEHGNGRLGAFVLDTASGRSFGWRQHERFTHCSSFKLSLAAMMLAGHDTGTISLDRKLHWTSADLLGHSPVTSAHVATGLSVRHLARAALIESDNTAANALLKAYGGPAAVTRFWRSLGDKVSRLDRYEPDLNVTPPGTALDTSTPAAMAATVRTLLYGKRLSTSSRATLSEWMRAVATGTDRIRAAFPQGWVSGDKTGTGPGTYVDLAFGGPVGRPPLIIAAYFEPAVKRPLIDPAATAVLADVGRVAVQYRRP